MSAPLRTLPSGRRQQRGVVALLVALVLPVLIASAAFAIDLAYVQNDADAAALAGAHALVDSATGQLRWSDAANKAQQSVSLNSAAGQPMQDAQVQTGYWNLKGQPSGLQPLPFTPTVWDVPAVAVTLRKQDGLNQGRVRTFFARFWQVLGIAQQVSAVAAGDGAMPVRHLLEWQRVPADPAPGPGHRPALCVQHWLGLPLRALFIG
jgi:Putative Tad-like Flp pilus-assembly